MSRRVTGDIFRLPLQDTVGQQREISAGNAKQGDVSRLTVGRGT
jgi:hypothetical protein